MDLKSNKIVNTWQGYGIGKADTCGIISVEDIKTGPRIYASTGVLVSSVE